jgi:TolB-like protein/Flp pilus assembly protein TadD
MMSLLGEIKRRKVFQVAAVYAIVAWLIIQIIGEVSEPLNLPGWLDTVVIVLIAIGFPIALVLAWAFDITPDGVTRDAGVDAPPKQQPAETDVMAPQHKSIVVLPFVNMSADPENEYFSDGLTEEIINALTQLKELRVVARTSSFVFKGKSADIAKIGHKLNVSYVLEGSVRKDKERLRITAQLINVANGYHIWSEQFDRELDDIFAIQNEIALAIVEKLKIRLVPHERSRLVEKRTSNLAAHEAYLKGRYFWNQRGPGLKKAVDLFKLALAEDDNYADAYVGLADTYALLAFYGYRPPTEVMPKAKDAVHRALEIDETLAEAHSSLGFIHTIFDWDWDSASKEFERALELNPSYSPARYWRTNLLMTQGRLEEAVSEISHSLEYDPLSIYMQAFLGVVLITSKKYQQASEHLLKALALEPTNFIARSGLGVAYCFQSRIEEGILEIQQAIDLSDRDEWPVAALGIVHAAFGDRSRAREILNELEQRARDEYVSAIHIAAIHAQLGEKDRAFEWLERAYEERCSLLFAVVNGYIGRTFDLLENEPRFHDLLRRIGLRDEE